MGHPVGIKTYRPYHATGEDFLQNYLGMIGLPMDIVPQFPTDQQTILLTEEAKFDTAIVSKIKQQLVAGKNVIITSGLLKALQYQGIRDIVELNCTDRKVSLNQFKVGWFGSCQSEHEILIPQIEYLTNDSWEDITSIKGASGWPVLHQAMYSKGSLFVLTIPDNFSDLYQLPDLVLNRIRQVASQDIDIHLEGPAQVSLFCYDNGGFIVESYLAQPVTVKVVIKKSNAKIQDVLTNETVAGTAGQSPRIWGRAQDNTTTFEVTIKPHSFKAFKTML
jgi:hypothetical protein